MMACGVTVVTNDDPTKRWLLEPEQNSLAVEPTVSCIVEALERAVGDADLRKRLGLAAAARLRRTTWEEQVDRVYASLLGTSAAAETVAPMLRQQLASTG
jgi:glycosyltransferase involved in cell wall biosynthesis